MIVERSTSLDAGYAIALYPSGSCIFHGLGTYRQLVEQSLTVERYELADGSSRLLKAFDMSVLTAAAGPMLMVSRTDLVRLLEQSCPTADLRRGVTVTALVEHEDAVDVTFDDDSTGRFDAVVGCDGMSSSTRELAFGAPTGFDSGWVLWTWWVNPERFEPDIAREWWGAGCFFGVYPAPGHVMCAAGGPADVWPDGDLSSSFLHRHLAKVADHVPAVRAAIDEAHDAYRWAMRDVRADRWINGRIALCGDAAAGFLPTAGVGASNALRSAAALADELSRADAATVPLAFELYEKRCRSTVERNQTDSRRLGRAMFVRRPVTAWVRDRLARHYPPERMLSQVVQSMHEPL